MTAPARPAPSTVQTSLQHRDQLIHAMSTRLARIEALAALGLGEGGVAAMASALRDILDVARPSVVDAARDRVQRGRADDGGA